METQNAQTAETLKHDWDIITVLVEDEGLVRRLWEDHYQKKGWRLETFENPLDFLAQLDRFTGRSEKLYFFFDQDFGKVRGVGVELARAVYGKNCNQTISLVTNYSPAEFRSELGKNYIQHVFGKYPEALFGNDFLTRQFSEQIELFTSTDPTGCSALEKALNFNGWDLQFKLETHCPDFAPKFDSKQNPCFEYAPMNAAIPSHTSFWGRFSACVLYLFAGVAVLEKTGGIIK